MKYGKPIGPRSREQWEKNQAKFKKESEWSSLIEDVPTGALFIIPGAGLNSTSGQMFKKGGNYETTCTADLVYPVPRRTQVARIPHGTPVYAPSDNLITRMDKAWGFETPTKDLYNSK